MRRLLLAALLILPVAAHAQSGIALTDAFTRAAAVGGVGGAFVTVANTGAADRLTGVASPDAAKAELHESLTDNGVMKMRPVSGIDVPAGATVKLAPGGYHIMLIGLKHALVAGEAIQLTLIFAKAGPVTTTARILKAGASMPAGHGMNGHGMNGHDMGQMPGMSMPGMPMHGDAPAK
jgi:copper(I)-binding protein